MTDKKLAPLLRPVKPIAGVAQAGHDVAVVVQVVVDRGGHDGDVRVGRLERGDALGRG